MSYAGYELWPVGSVRRVRPRRRFIAIGTDFIAPTTPPPFSFSVPDGKGGWTTVGTLSQPAAPPKPVGPPPAIAGWVQVGAAAAGGVAALATLWLILKKGKSR
jgi:hypothetical protein